MSRAAETSAPIHPVLAERWSPRSFDPTKSLTMADLTPAFEAARWAPSANNAQEWRFLVGFRGDATFAALTERLSGWNASWAPTAGAIVIGDKRSDVELADAIGGLGLLLASGHGCNDLDWANANGVPVFAGFLEAACFAAGLKTAHPAE